MISATDVQHPEAIIASKVQIVSGIVELEGFDDLYGTFCFCVFVLLADVRVSINR